MCVALVRWPGQGRGDLVVHRTNTHGGGSEYRQQRNTAQRKERTKCSARIVYDSGLEKQKKELQRNQILSSKCFHMLSYLMRYLLKSALKCCICPVESISDRMPKSALLAIYVRDWRLQVVNTHRCALQVVKSASTSTWTHC